MLPLATSLSLSLARFRSYLCISRSRSLHPWQAHEGAVALCNPIEGTGSQLLAVGGGSELWMYDVRTGALCRHEQRNARVRTIAMFQDEAGVVLLDGGFDRQVTMQQANLGSSLFAYPSSGGIEGQEVKSVALSTDGAMLAIGYESAKQGLLELYDTRHNKCLLTRKDPKQVSAVALTPDGRLLAAAGYSCALRVYDTNTLATVIEVDYNRSDMPAFIWSLAFSADSQTLAVGCWDRFAYRYRINEDFHLQPTHCDGKKVVRCKRPCFSNRDLSARVLGGSAVSLSAPAPSSSSVEASKDSGVPYLREAGKIERSDRVYSISLDYHGQHMLVGGRDKCCCLVRFSDQLNEVGAPAAASAPETAEGAEVIWVARAEDMVYSVALSSDLRFAAHAGPTMCVDVLDGRTGTRLHRHHNGFAVWCLRLLDDKGSAKLAYTGQSSTISTIDLERMEVDFEMPAVDVGTVYGCAMSSTGLCWSAGNHVMMLGRGGNCFGWQDRPSYKLVTSLVTEFLNNEDLLLRCLGHLLRRHPTLASLHCPHTHDSILHFVVSTCSRTPSVIDLLLSVPTPYGMQPNLYGITALHAAMVQGGKRAMQLLQKAILDERVALTQASVVMISSCMCATAQLYPRDFLRFIERMRLQPEPEVFIKADEADVVLPEILTAGSAEYLPLGLWSDQLVAHRIHRREETHASEHHHLMSSSSVLHAAEEIEKGIETFAKAHAHIPRRRRAAAAAAAASGRIGLSYFEASKRAKIVETMDDIPEGFRTSMANGVKAFRIPFDSFASELTTHLGETVSPLELICNAATETREYSVFGSRPVDL